MKTAPRPAPDFGKDPNAQAILRAGRRSSNVNAGKDSEEGLVPEPPVEEEGGIVAEAEEQLEEAQEAEPEAETSAEPEAETSAEPEAETPAEPEAETSAEPEAETSAEPASDEFTPPEGPTHDELVDEYHDALIYGDAEKAKSLYCQLMDHRYGENKQRAKQETMTEQEAQAYVATAKELAAKHPELNEDGLATNRVLALKNVYVEEGMRESDALRKAVADLYPEQASMEPEPEQASAEPEPPAMPDMTERKVNKRKVPSIPATSAKNEPEPEPEQPTRTSAIQKMREARGQG